MDEVRVEKIQMEDGRLAERRVKEEQVDDCEVVKVTELHVEEERPKKLQRRIVEKKKPFIYERHIETIDGKGKVVDSKIESINSPESEMKVVKHISTVDESVGAQSVDDCAVTRDELMEIMTSMVKAIKEDQGTCKNSGRVSAFQVQTEERTKSKNSSSMWGNLLMMAIAAEIATIAYIVFMM